MKNKKLINQYVTESLMLYTAVPNLEYGSNDGMLKYYRSTKVESLMFEEQSTAIRYGNILSKRDKEFDNGYRIAICVVDCTRVLDLLNESGINGLKQKYTELTTKNKDVFKGTDGKTISNIDNVIIDLLAKNKNITGTRDINILKDHKLYTNSSLTDRYIVYNIFDRSIVTAMNIVSN